MQLKEEHPGLEVWEIGKMVSELWNSIPLDDRQPLFEIFELEKVLQCICIICNNSIVQSNGTSNFTCCRNDI